MSESVETSEAPQPSFDALDLSSPVRRALADMGFKHPTPVQVSAFEPACAGGDLIVQARTGTGKTLGFALPLVDRLVDEEPGVQALVLAPTRELALQSAREMEKVAKYRKISTVAVYGGASMEKQVAALHSGAQIVSGTPGRVLDHIRRGTLDPRGIRVLVLDEADEMFSMGFAKELHSIMDELPDQRQMLCFSATIDTNVERIAERRMTDPQFITLSSDAVGASEISHYIYMCMNGDKLDYLRRILDVEDPESAIVFCNTKAETESVARALQAAGYNADWLNGDLPQTEREKIMKRTREGKLRYMIATDVAARGIDVSHLTHVLNYGFPEAAEQYVHRTGRTGRAGRTGTAISIVGPENLGAVYYLRLTFKIFPLERSLPSAIEQKTRQETDRVELLVKHLVGEASEGEYALAQRLLSHPLGERIVAGLLSQYFRGLGSPEEIDAEAAALRKQPSEPDTATDGAARNPAAKPVAEAAVGPAGSARKPRRPRLKTAQAEDAKAEDAKAEDAKAEDAKAEDVKAEDVKAEDVKAQPSAATEGAPETAAREAAASEKPTKARKPRTARTSAPEDPSTKEPKPKRATKARARAEAPAEEAPKPKRATKARTARAEAPAEEATKPKRATKARTARTTKATARKGESAETGETPQEPDPAEQTPPTAQWTAEPAPVLDDAMTTLYLNVGKRDGVAKAEVSDLLRQRAGLGGDDLGRVRVRDNHTFVGVPAERAEAVIESLSGTALGEVQLTVERARS